MGDEAGDPPVCTKVIDQSTRAFSGVAPPLEGGKDTVANLTGGERVFGERAETADQRARSVWFDQRDVPVPADLTGVRSELVEDEDEYVRLPVLWRPLGVDGAADDLAKQMKVAFGSLLRPDAFWCEGDEREALRTNLFGERR